MRYKRCLSLILALGMATTCMPMGMGLSEEAIVPVIEVMEEPQPAEVKIEEPTVVYSEAEQTDVTSDGNEDADGLGVIQTEPEDEVVDVQKSSDDQSSDPVVDVLVLEAPTLVYDPEWDYDETTELLTIPAASEDDVICLEWTAVDGAVDYCVETAELAGSGELAAFIELDRSGDESVELTAKDYLDGWYALFITAKAEDGQEAQFVQVFRVTLPAADETIREATVYQETAATLVITKQPVSVTVAEGETAKLVVEASGEGLSYAWWVAAAGSKNFSKSSVTGSSYAVTMNATRDGRQLYCVVTDASGNSVTSNTVTMNMKKALAITKQPESVTVAEGETAKLVVEASGEGLSYEWWVAAAGSTKFSKSSESGSTYAVPMNATRDGRQLYCIVSDANGNTVKTNTVTINMKKALTITKQPESVTVAEGETAKLVVEASGEGLSYEWWVAAAGSTKFSKSSESGSTYAVPMNATRDGRQLYCIVSDANGNTAKTNTVTINMKKALTITKQPESVTVADGELAKISVEASGEGLSYAWWVAAAGSTKFSKSSVTTGNYSVTMNATRDGRQLYCVITDAKGNTVTTNTVTMNMKKALTITKQPESVTVADGELAKISVEASGEGLSYAWWVAAAGSTKFSKSSVTTSNYSVTMNASRDGRQLYCVITDANGNTVTTDTVTMKMSNALAITKQPESVAVPDGETAKVSVEASGSGLTYTWWVAAPGSTKFSKSSITTNYYAVAMNASRAGRQLYCVVTDANGNNVQSDTVTIDMSIPLVITKQPENVAVAEGEFAKVSVEASGEGLVYEWWFAAAGSTKFSKSSITTSSYSAKMDASRSGRQLYCIVTDAYGARVQSDTVTMSMITPLEITKQPVSATALDGKIVEVVVEAVGDGLTYEWWVAPANSTNFSKSSITTNVYAAPMNSTRDGRKVYCVVTDAYGNSVTSDTVSIHLNPGFVYEYSETYGGLVITGYTGTDTAITIPEAMNGETVTCVGDGAFMGNAALVSVKIPQTVTRIGENAFKGCSSLTDVNVPNTITKIEASTFEACTSLTSITLPNCITVIGKRAFYGCSKLASMNSIG